jgi:hypothetical protein
MNILVTILQCRRVALPFLFVRYAVPMMRAQRGCSVCVHIVQHECLLKNINAHETSKLPASKQDLVVEWTEGGRYSGAFITRHSEQFERYPSIPSRRIAAEFAARQTYDLHLWLEDDAFVYDVDCARWSENLDANVVGSYRENNFGYVNTAHYVCRPSLDIQLLPFLGREEFWDLASSMYMIKDGVKALNLSSPRIEPTITRLATKRIAQLPSCAAARYNARKPESIVGLKRLLRQACSGDLHTLSIDFPDTAWD